MARRPPTLDAPDLSAHCVPGPFSIMALLAPKRLGNQRHRSGAPGTSGAAESLTHPNSDGKKIGRSDAAEINRLPVIVSPCARARIQLPRPPSIATPSNAPFRNEHIGRDEFPGIIDGRRRDACTARGPERSGSERQGCEFFGIETSRMDTESLTEAWDGQIQGAMESCFGKSLMSGVMGFGMGGLFGMFMASVCQPPSPPLSSSPTFPTRI